MYVLARRPLEVLTRGEGKGIAGKTEQAAKKNVNRQESLLPPEVHYEVLNVISNNVPGASA